MDDNISLVEKVWNKILVDLKAQVSDQTYNAWFVPIKAISLEKDILCLGVPNDFYKDWVMERYVPLIQTSLCAVTGEKMHVQLKIMDQILPEEHKKAKTNESDENNLLKNKDSAEKEGLFSKIFSHKKKSGSLQKGINHNYTFESFVIGASNRFTHAACLAISDAPAKTYNPLFIYGGVGLGKTHLMHSIGNHLAANNSKASILYISSEQFTNQLITAIQTRTMDSFRKRFRSVDVLLIDDIHFIAGKDSTQEEFFHTFNTLYNDHKQIVMSSDRSPKEIPALEERLVSRFAWGLVGDIQAPDFETRIAILQKKLEKGNTVISNDVLYFIAETIKTNIRELEGGLIRVIAYSKLMNQEVSINLAKEVLKGMISEGKKVNVSYIQEKVAEYFNLNVRDLKGKKRTKQIVYPRQIAMFISREITSLSLPEIGAYFGGKDHTTVIHAYNKIDKEIKGNGEITKIVDAIVKNINK